MSVCCDCIKTSADSKQNYDKTIFLNISDTYIESNTFDTTCESIESNIFKDDCLFEKMNNLKIKK